MCVYVLIVWLFDWLIAWLVDWLIDWLSDWVIEWLSEWASDWPIDWLVDWMNGWLLDWLIELVFLLLLRILAPRLMNPNSACDANMNVDHQGGATVSNGSFIVIITNVSSVIMWPKKYSKSVFVKPTQKWTCGTVYIYIYIITWEFFIYWCDYLFTFVSACTGAEVSKIGDNCKKSMAYRKVFAMQKQWIVEVVRCTNAWANGGWYAMKETMHNWPNEPINPWINECVN